MDKKEIPQGWNVIDGKLDENKKISASKNFRDQQKVQIPESSEPKTRKSSSTQERSSGGHRPSKKKGSKLLITGVKLLSKTKFKSKTLPYLLAGAIAIGGISAVGHTVYNNTVNTPITLEQAVDDLGMSYDDLGISENTVNDLENLEAQLDSGDLSLNDLVSSGKDLEELEFEIIKDKLAQALDVNATDITVHSNEDSSSPSTETIRVTTENGEQIYVEKDFFNSLGSNNTFSQKIADFIITIGNTQTLTNKISNGNVDYEDTIKSLKKQIQETYKFAATQISVNDKGNLIVHVTRQNDLPENSQEEALLKDDDDLEL